jgi:hypothetical protein
VRVGICERRSSGKQEAWWIFAERVRVGICERKGVVDFCGRVRE